MYILDNGTSLYSELSPAPQCFRIGHATGLLRVNDAYAKPHCHTIAGSLLRKGEDGTLAWLGRVSPFVAGPSGAEPGTSPRLPGVSANDSLRFFSLVF